MSPKEVLMLNGRSQGSQEHQVPMQRVMVKVNKLQEPIESHDEESPDSKQIIKSTMPEDFLVIKGFPNQSPRRDEPVKHISFAKFRQTAVSSIKKPFSGSFIINGDMPIYKPIFDRQTITITTSKVEGNDEEKPSQDQTHNNYMFRHNKMLPAESFLKQKRNGQTKTWDEKSSHSVTPSLAPNKAVFDN